MAVLIGRSGEIQGTRFEITKDRVVLGRNATCDIVLKDHTVSSQHCYIARRGDQYLLHDLNSTNGTQVNGQRISEAVLEPQQVVQVGGVELVFETSPSDAPPLEASASTQVVIDSAPATVTTPKSFASVSPFGARRRDNRALWLTLFIIIGLLALVGGVFFLRQLLV